MCHVLIFLFSKLHFSAPRISLVNHNHFHKTFQYLLSSLFAELQDISTPDFSTPSQRYTTYRVLQTIQMKLILLCVWAEPAALGSIKTALKFKYEI